MRGLLLELADGAVGAEVHDAEAGGLLHGDLNDRDRAGRLRLLMGAEHLGIVHLVDMVTGEDEHMIGIIHLDEVHVLIDGVGRAGEPGALFPGALIRREDVNAAVLGIEIPRLAAADIAVQTQRLILREHTHGVNAGVGAVGEREIDDAVLAAEGHVGLCHLGRECVEAGALSARQQHGNTGLFQNDHSFPAGCPAETYFSLCTGQSRYFLVLNCVMALSGPFSMKQRQAFAAFSAAARIVSASSFWKVLSTQSAMSYPE